MFGFVFVVVRFGLIWFGLVLAWLSLLSRHLPIEPHPLPFFDLVIFQ
jgi:hypothetical protein